MADFSMTTSLRLMQKTASFLVFRLVVYFGIALAYVLATGMGAGVGYGIGGFWDDETQLSAAAYGAMAGFGLTAAALYLLREYVLYIVKAGHIAVMVEALRGRDFPAGQGQIAYARAMVERRFGTANVLFGIDQSVKAVIAAVTGLMQGMLSLLPIPGLNKLMSLARAYLRIAVGLLDEVMLAHCFDTKSENPYEASRNALALYAQTARPMLVNAAWVTLWVWGLSLVTFLVMLAPAAAVAWALPGQLSAAGVVFALLFAWAVKAAVIEPFAVACMMQAYFRLTQGQQPDPAWQTRLDKASNTFKSLGQMAMTWVRPRRA